MVNYRVFKQLQNGFLKKWKEENREEGRRQSIQFITWRNEDRGQRTEDRGQEERTDY